MKRKRAISLIKAGYKEAIDNIAEEKKDLMSEIINDIYSYLEKLENSDLTAKDIEIVEQLFNKIIAVRIEKNVQMEDLQVLIDATLNEKMNAMLRRFAYKFFQMDVELADMELLDASISENGKKLKKLMAEMLSNPSKNSDEATLNHPKENIPKPDYSHIVMWYKKLGPVEADIESIIQLEKLIGPQPEFDFAMGREDRDTLRITTELYIECIEKRLLETDKKLKEYDLPLDSFKEISEYIEKIKGMQFTLGELALINELYFKLISDRLYNDVNWIDSGEGYRTISEDDYDSKKNMNLWGLINDSETGINVKFYDIIRASIKEGLKYPCPVDQSRYYYIYPEVVSKLEDIIGPQPEYDIIMRREN